MDYIFRFFRQPKPKVSVTDTIVGKLNQLLKQGEKIMMELDDLKVAVADIAADNLALADEVKVAMDRIGELAAAGNMDAVKTFAKEAADSLRASHAGFQATLTGLKAKVDEVSASNGDAG
jgi:hypothetical protein